jgi:hypothetical protein
MKQTALQQLLHQMREERSKLPLLIEWDRCYQAIEMVIVNTYLPIEKEQIEDAYAMGSYDMASKEFRPGQYYNEIYKNKL